MYLKYKYISPIIFCVIFFAAGFSAMGQSSQLIVNPNCSLVVRNATISVGGLISSNQNFDLQKGTLLLNAVDYDQVIRGDLFYKRTIQNLKIANSNEVKIVPVQDDTLKLSGNLLFLNPNSKLLTSDRLTLLSDLENTANVGVVGPSNLITGKVTVERYINTGTSTGQHPKSWQLVTAPVTGQSIYDSWLEGGLKTLVPIGYGTSASGSLGIEGGFDVYSAQPSIKSFSAQTNNYVGIGSPKTTMVNSSNGFMVFVRGDRSVFNFSGNNSAPIPTILRASGNLITGTTGTIIIKKGAMQSIANPYASNVDFDKISRTTGIDKKFYVWDPNLSGTYRLGGYHSISKVNGWVAVPGGTSVYSDTEPHKQIQSGQTFFVFSTSGNNQEELFFTEGAKNVETSTKTFARPEGTMAPKISSLRINLFTGGGPTDILADGNLVVFDDEYSDLFDGDDALKIINEGENFSLKREGKTLIIEARNQIKSGDTLFYEIKNLKQRNYQFRIYPENLFPGNNEAYWVDNFLKTETYLPLNDSTKIDFNISAATGSNAGNRFMIVFKTAKVLSVDINLIEAEVQNQDISVRWKTENENNIAHYLLERSGDGHNFKEIGTVSAGNKLASTDYNYTDSSVASGKYYYRIKIVDKNGSYSYSKIVFIKILNESKSRIWPNPVQQDEIRVNVGSSVKGTFKVRLFNSEGKLIYQQLLQDQTGTLILKTKKLTPGIYHLELIKPGNETDILEVVKVEN